MRLTLNSMIPPVLSLKKVSRFANDLRATLISVLGFDDSIFRLVTSELQTC